VPRFCCSCSKPLLALKRRALRGLRSTEVATRRRSGRHPRLPTTAGPRGGVAPRCRLARRDDARDVARGNHPDRLGALESQVRRSMPCYFAMRHRYLSMRWVTAARFRPATSNNVDMWSSQRLDCSSAASIPVGYPADELLCGNAAPLDRAMHSCGTLSSFAAMRRTVRFLSNFYRADETFPNRICDVGTSAVRAAIAGRKAVPAIS
jgi:hypothetical protein